MSMLATVAPIVSDVPSIPASIDLGTPIGVAAFVALIVHGIRWLTTHVPVIGKIPIAAYVFVISLILTMTLMWEQVTDGREGFQVVLNFFVTTLFTALASSGVATWIAGKSLIPAQLEKRDAGGSTGTLRIPPGSKLRSLLIGFVAVAAMTTSSGCAYLQSLTSPNNEVRVYYTQETYNNILATIVELRKAGVIDDEMALKMNPTIQEIDRLFRRAYEDIRNGTPEDASKSIDRIKQLQQTLTVLVSIARANNVQ